MKTTDSGQSPLLLLEVLKTIRKNDIDYAVIGALAATFYGVVRASLDADAVISLAFASLRGLEQTFKKARYQTELRKGEFDDPIGALLSVSDKYGNRVDLLAGIRGMDPDAFSRAVEAPILGKRIRLIGLEDFIAMKIFAGSPKDLADAKNAISVSGKQINRALLRKVTGRFGKSSVRVLKTLLMLNVLVFFPALLWAEWNVREEKDPRVIAAACRPLEEHEKPQLTQFTHKEAVVSLCWESQFNPPKNGTFQYQYSVTFKADPKSPPKTLLDEGEMMAWSMRYEAKGDRLSFLVYWDQRQVRSYQISCEGPCKIEESCEIERLSTDLPPKTLFDKISPFLKTTKSRSDFVMGEANEKQNAALLHQLFMEALTGNTKAKDLLSKLNEGSDAAWAEVLLGYQGIIEESAPMNCHWNPPAAK